MSSERSAVHKTKLSEDQEAGSRELNEAIATRAVACAKTLRWEPACRHQGGARRQVWRWCGRQVKREVDEIGGERGM